MGRRLWPWGMMCLTGTGVLSDDKKALAWFIQADEKHVPVAAYYLGLIYETGAEGIRDPEKARASYGKAAEQGNIQAQFKTGELYTRGVGG